MLEVNYETTQFSKKKLHLGMLNITHVKYYHKMIAGIRTFMAEWRAMVIFVLINIFT